MKLLYQGMDTALCSMAPSSPISSSSGMCQLEEIKEILRGAEYKLRECNAADAVEYLAKIHEIVERMLPVEVLTVDQELLTFKTETLVRLDRVILESKEPVDIDWKVKKYTLIIQSLLRFFQKLDISDGDVDGFLVLPRPPMKELHDILASSNKRPEINQEYLEFCRSKIECFIYKLRGLLFVNPEDPQLCQIARHFFVGTNLEPYCQQLLRKFNAIGSGQRGGAPSVPFPQSLHEMHKNFQEAPQEVKTPILSQFLNSVRGQIGHDFDAYVQGNPCHVTFSFFSTERCLRALGMGNPTNQDFLVGTKVNLEFEGFLTSLKQAGERFLFISNQNYLSGSFSGWGDETGRMRATLIELPKKYPGTLFTVAFSKNSPFYHQEGAWSVDTVDAEIFINQLVAEHFGKVQETGNYIDPQILESFPTFYGEARKIAEKMHEHLYKNSKTLTRQNRQIFNSLYHVFLSKVLLVKLNTDFFTICCKDGIDRGAESKAEFFGETVIAKGREHDPQAQERIAVLMLTRALLVRKREPIHERVKQLVRVIEFCLIRKKELGILEAELGLSGWDVGPPCVPV